MIHGKEIRKDGIYDKHNWKSYIRRRYYERFSICMAKYRCQNKTYFWNPYYVSSLHVFTCYVIHSTSLTTKSCIMKTDSLYDTHNLFSPKPWREQIFFHNTLHQRVRDSVIRHPGHYKLSTLLYIFSYRMPYCPAKLSQCNESQLSAFTLYALAEDRSTVIFKILWTKVRRFLTSCLHNSPKSWKISSRQNKSWKEFFTTREHLLSIFDRHLLLHIFLFFLHRTLPVGKASYLLTAKNCTAYVALWFPAFTPASTVFLVSK